MTKNSSNARKARIRAQADKAGISYRQAAREVDAKRAQEEDAHGAQKARLRAFIHNPEDLAEERTRYLSHMLAAELPQGISFTVPELADLTGLSPLAVEDSLNLARAHGWMTGDSSDDARLCVPGEDIDMYEMFLKRISQPVRDSELHNRVLQQIEQELS